MRCHLLSFSLASGHKYRQSFAEKKMSVCASVYVNKKVRIVQMETALFVLRLTDFGYHTEGLSLLDIAKKLKQM